MGWHRNVGKGRVAYCVSLMSELHKVPHTSSWAHGNYKGVWSFWAACAQNVLGVDPEAVCGVSVLGPLYSHWLLGPVSRLLLPHFVTGWQQEADTEAAQGSVTAVATARLHARPSWSCGQMSQPRLRLKAFSYLHEWFSEEGKFPLPVNEADSIPWFPVSLFCIRNHTFFRGTVHAYQKRWKVNVRMRAGGEGTAGNSLCTACWLSLGRVDLLFWALVSLSVKWGDQSHPSREADVRSKDLECLRPSAWHRGSGGFSDFKNQYLAYRELADERNQRSPCLENIPLISGKGGTKTDHFLLPSFASFIPSLLLSVVSHGRNDGRLWLQTTWVRVWLFHTLCDIAQVM